jgi:hypothetical protein
MIALLKQAKAREAGDSPTFERCRPFHGLQYILIS